MMFLHSLTKWLRKPIAAKATPPRPSARLRLEHLEDRVVPSFTTATYTNATVQITPGFTVTEKVTATVTNFQGFDFSTGQITPIPTGATNPTSGTVLFNMNNQQQSATLNSSGQATVTFQVPLLAFLTSQGLTMQYLGTTDSSGDTWEQSLFFAPLYKNWDNVLFAGMLTFNQLTPQQVYAQQISEFQSPSGTPSATYLNYSAQGETDTINVNGTPLAFNYVDPGIINTITALGLTVPGFPAAAQLGAYNGFNVSASNK
jgi:hypothetical protein